MQAVWNRLGKEDTNKVLDTLSGRADAIVFSQQATEVATRDLPFYKGGYRLYRLVNYATMPVFSMTYLGNGTDFHALDGTAAPIYTVNEAAPAAIGEDNVLAYLDFFFGNVQGSEGDIFLIRTPLKMPFFGLQNEQVQQGIVANFRAVRVHVDAATQNIHVSGTFYYGAALLGATLAVTPDGKLSFVEQSLLLTGVHFPDSPYRQQRELTA